MFQLRKKSIIDATSSREEASKYVELESKVTKGVQESTYIEPVDDA